MTKPLFGSWDFSSHFLTGVFLFRTTPQAQAQNAQEVTSATKELKPSPLQLQHLSWSLRGKAMRAQELLPAQQAQQAKSSTPQPRHFGCQHTDVSPTDVLLGDITAAAYTALTSCIVDTAHSWLQEHRVPHGKHHHQLRQESISTRKPPHPALTGV